MKLRPNVKAMALALATSLSTMVMAQNLKVGYANMQYIVTYMPESKAINHELETLRYQLTVKIQSKHDALQAKMSHY